VTVLRFVIDVGVIVLALVGVVEIAAFLLAPFTPPTVDWDEDDERLI